MSGVRTLQASAGCGAFMRTFDSQEKISGKSQALVACRFPKRRACVMDYNEDGRGKRRRQQLG